jgi:hypothetical protein
MESQRFDESFKQAFDGAELAPSEGVWTNVELELEKKSSGKMKRRLIMFQLLAAASTVFALGFGAVYYLNVETIRATETLQASEQSKVTSEKTEVLNNLDQPQTAKALVDQNSSGATANKAVKKQHAESNPSVASEKQVTTQSAKTPNSVLLTSSAYSTAKDTTMYRVSEPGISFRYVVRTPSLNILKKEVEPETVPDAGMVLLAKLKDEERRYQQEQAQPKEKIWTSVGMGAGMYNPNVQTSSTVISTSIGGGRATSSKPSMGTSYTVGVSVGHKIAKRIILQGGVSYLTQNADFSSGASQNGVAALTEYASFNKNSDASFVAASPYTVNSSLQFISVPLQAGYVLVDRDFAIQLNGGITTDLFLSNTLTSEDENYKTVSQSAGENSPYRSVNFSGLVGTEFSYKVAQQYRISLVPGVRYSLNSIYKSEIGTQINPIVYDVSLRVRYIFK